MKINSILILFSLALVAMTSCASQKSAAYAYDSGNGGSFQKGMLSEESDKKIIYSSTINLTVKIPDTAAVQISGIATKYKGYVQQTGTTMCVIRVEAKHLKTAMDEIALLGKVTNKTSYGEDVTDQYADYAIRLENAEKARMRYLELLARAENVQAALLVEKELERLNETIELMKGQMNRIDHLSTYSTITVYLKEKKKPGVIGYIGIGVYKAVKWLFVRN
jgi:DNA-binding PucR family transcriptional regulator